MYQCPSCPDRFWTHDAFETHWENSHRPTEGDLCAGVFGCPNCGERRMDWLEWLPPYYDELKCQTCGQKYEP